MPDCKSCKAERREIPLLVHESDMARAERTIRRLWILALVALVLLVGSNFAWVVYEHQFVTEEAQVEVDTGDGDAYVAGIGDVTIGESKGNVEEAQP